MTRRHWQSLSAVLFGMFVIHEATAVRPYTFAPTVIYGEDDRLDYYQVPEDDIKTLADSTVALVRSASLEILPGVTNFKTMPYGASMGLCQEEPFFNQETLAFCSGSLVAPDIVLTAGHCIRNQLACESTKFVFGFRLNDAVALPKSAPTDMVFSCKTLLHTVADPKGEDFALVRLDRAVTHVKPLAYRDSGALIPFDGLRVMGHPAGLPLKVAGGAVVRTVNSTSGFLVANLDTYGGNSGSAVFNSVDGRVEGVLVRGEMDYTYKNGCRVSNVCPPEGCRGEDVTLMERVLPELNKALASP